MKKGICYGALPGADATAKAQLAASAGFSGVELPTIDSIDETSRVRDAIFAAGLGVPSIMCSGHWAHPLSHPDREERELCKASIRRSVDEAVEVGADTVLVVPGVVNEVTPYEDAYVRSQAELAEVTEYAGARKVVLAIENVGNRFLLSPIEFCRFIDEADSPWVKAYFDIGNIVPIGYPQHWIRSLGKRLHKIHAKGYRLESKSSVYLLEGSIDWGAVVASIREVGYDDYITVEMSPYPSFPEQMVHDASRHLDMILAL